jgi:hypothetical protein
LEDDLFPAAGNPGYLLRKKFPIRCFTGKTTGEFFIITQGFIVSETLSKLISGEILGS